MRWPHLVTWMALLATNAGAQGVRITGSSWWQGIDLRPFRRDSVARSLTTESNGIRRGPDGTIVSCPDGVAYCAFLAAATRVLLQPVLHDISVAGWGMGEGISVHAHGRARTPLGEGDPSWPRMADPFDLLDAYVEVDRTRGRLRLGRQWTLGGLGAYSYDGGSLLIRGGAFDGEVLGGRALVQGINEAYTAEEIGQVDDLPPDNGAWLVGGRGRWRSTSGVQALTAAYLRIIADDRSGVYADRVALDGSTRWLGARMDAALAYDLASGIANEARIRAARRITRGLDLSAEVRRHRPFFELWTIWGAFAPVGFDEVRVTGTWTSADGGRSVSASSARRRYSDPGTGLQSVPLRTDGWRLAMDGSWQPGEAWSVVASYGADVGVGASQTDGLAGFLWRPTREADFGASFSARQTIYEYRVGTGRVLGGFAHASMALRPDLRLRVEAGQYRHRLTNDAVGPDWSQRRASVRLEWAVGADPGRDR
ncbi:MAG: hypothetical protein IT361_12580 [Gemmatimonadaceae bacterium]|nr:hypothetical protein [Gemmatimonadaceae bacterium]